MRSRRGPKPVVFMLGKPVKPGSIIDGVLAALADQGLACTVALPHEADPPLAALADARLLIHRGLNPELLDEIHRRAAAGLRCCNPLPAALAVHDRLHGTPPPGQTAPARVGPAGRGLLGRSPGPPRAGSRLVRRVYALRPENHAAWAA